MFPKEKQLSSKALVDLVTRTLACWRAWKLSGGGGGWRAARAAGSQGAGGPREVVAGLGD